MDFSNLKKDFYVKGETRGTLYKFGNSRVEIIKDQENYQFIYENGGTTKIDEFSQDLPKNLAIQIKNLHYGIGIDSREIQSCIWSIQVYLRRCANNQSK